MRHRMKHVPRAPQTSPLSGAIPTTRPKYSAAFLNSSFERQMAAMCESAWTEYALCRSADSYEATARSRSPNASAVPPVDISPPELVLLSSRRAGHLQPAVVVEHSACSASYRTGRSRGEVEERAYRFAARSLPTPWRA